MNSDQENLIRFVECYINLPDEILKKHGIKIPHKGDNVVIEFFNGIREQYRSIGLWMKYYLCDVQVLSVLRLPEHSRYKSLADISLAWYRLAQETLLLSPELEKPIKRAVVFWLAIEIERCELLLEKTGITNNPKLPLSKRNHYKEICSIASLDPTTLKSGGFEKISSPSELLLNEAWLLCRNPDNIQFRRKYRDFMTALKRADRQIMMSDAQDAYLKDGKICVLRS